MTEWNEEDWLEKVTLDDDGCTTADELGDWWVCTVCDGTWRVGEAAEHGDEMCPVKIVGEREKELADMRETRRVEVLNAQKECVELRAEAERLRKRTHEIADAKNAEHAERARELSRVCARLDNAAKWANESLRAYIGQNREIGTEPGMFREPYPWWRQASEHNRMAVLGLLERVVTAEGRVRLLRDASNLVEAHRERAEDLQRRLNATVAALNLARPFVAHHEPVRSSVDAALAAAAQPQADAPPVTQAELQAAVDASRKPDDMAAWASKLAADITKDATIADRETHQADAPHPLAGALERMLGDEPPPDAYTRIDAALARKDGPSE